MPNIIDFKAAAAGFRTPGLQFSVSGRKLSAGITAADYLRSLYLYLDITSIESVFGSTTTPSPLYGGRTYKPEHSFTPAHIEQLYSLGIGVSLTLTNHFFSDEHYRESLPLLRSMHRPGNSVICTNDELARRVRQEFPDYTLKASIIKHITTMEGIEEALALYDYAVLPMDMNDDDAFLDRIAEPARIMLFGNASCAYTCPARTCYRGFSEVNTGKSKSSTCSQGKVPRLNLGQVFFDVAKLSRMGFRLFKMIPPMDKAPVEVARALSKHRGTQEPSRG